VSIEEENRTARDRALFDRIARDYADKDLHPAQRAARAHRLMRTLATLERQRDLKILEIGCGAGFAATYLAGTYDSYVGIDHSEPLVAYARVHNAEPGATFHTVDVGAYDPGDTFDLIFMIGVLHHLDDPVGTLEQLRHLLGPGGVVAVNEPQAGNPLIRAARAIRKRIDSGYSGDQVEYSETQLRHLFIEAGYSDIGIVAQGLFSTPFAEVVTPLQTLTTPLARISCALDTAIENSAQPIARRLSWNLIATASAGA